MIIENQILRSTTTVVYLALGSNLGDKLQYIHTALNLIQRRIGRVRQTSFLYRSVPQYVTDQPDFLNSAIEVETEITDMAELLHLIKDIEREIGRSPPSLRYGPRVIDIDILFHAEEVLSMAQTSEGALEIPHPRICEREFVLQPMLDLAPEFVHPQLHRSIAELMCDFRQSTPVSGIDRVLPLNETHVIPMDRQTLMMGILNITPDSFSEDGLLGHTSLSLIMEKVASMVQSCDIIDIGGESSRPGAACISHDEELGRVLPVIQAIRAKYRDFPLSIDTTKASVAQEAVKAGVNMINDISGGRASENGTIAIAAQYQVPLVLMHMRGTPETMSGMKQYPQGVVVEVVGHLQQLEQISRELGIPRWNLVLDPGIGFAKDKALNLDLLRNLRTLVREVKCPVLIGSSRKKFIGEICGRPNPVDRFGGTAATSCAAIQAQVAILRVHDHVEMKDIIMMSDAMWKDPC